jgi:hypothetical protein
VASPAKDCGLAQALYAAESSLHQKVPASVAVKLIVAEVSEVTRTGRS